MPGISARFRNLDQEIARLNEELSQLTREELDRVGDQLVEDLRAATPVDTGRARAGWRASTVGPDAGRPGEFELVISNNVPYIGDLNRGASFQAPMRFVERTVLQSTDLSVRGNIVD